jgi:asparagine synthase (glutamine-hydrolysing)
LRGIFDHLNVIRAPQSMCGIAGAIALDGALARASDPLDRIVERMASCLTHRGPDASGLWKSPCGRVALAHRRLAIIDLTDTGRQPMEYAGRFWMSFNGEIYNFRELRGALRALGHSFRGESDTEVLLTAIAQWGIDDALRHCVGMFAFAVWDARDQVLHLGRDRMGEKPLYLGELFGHLFFASELRAFRAIPGFAARVSSVAASSYLRDGCVPGGRSIYEGVYKLPPGHVVSVRAGGNQRLSAAWPRAGEDSGAHDLRPRPYWSCENAAERGRGSVIKDPRAAIEEGEALIRQSVREQMHADVPTGAFLSGGIDSSLVTAVMQHQSSQPVRTFTVSFDDPRYDESRHARAIANHLGTHHEEFPLREREIVDQIPSIVHLMDEPTANGSFFPVYLISRLARSRVTVALSGDGGDELFGGYNRYVLAPTAWRRSRWVPSSFRKQLAGFLAGGGSPESSWLIGKLARFGSQVGSAEARKKLARVFASETFLETYLRLTSWWTDTSVLEGAQEGSSREWPREFTDDLSSMLLADQINYLPDDNLAKVDRASMATSLEMRLPLLDHRLVEFSWRLPPELKLRGRTTKWLLREILDRYVPRALIERPKMGFSVPVDQWLRGPLREWAGDMLQSQAFHGMLAVRPATIRRLWDDYLAGRGRSAAEIWALAMLSAWAESTAPKASTSELPAPAAAALQ